MYKQTISLIVLMTLAASTIGFVLIKVETKKVKIVKDEDSNIWRVRDKDGKNKGTLKVKKKDKIEWQAKGSNMVFTFPDSMDSYFDHEEGQFEEGYSQEIEDGKKLTLTVKPDAPTDTLEYQVFVVDADTFVIGNSPPKVIIQ